MEDSYPNYNEVVGAQNDDFFESPRQISTQDIETIVDKRNRVKEIDKFCSNNTLESEKEGTVIIVKPADSQATELISNPLEISRQISNSEFSKHKMKDIRINKRRKIIVMQLEKQNAEVIHKLLKVKKMGDIDITSYIPDKDRYKYGVIYPISTKVNMEQLLENITGNDSNSQVVKVERMKKRNGNEFVESESVKIIFEGSRLPEGIRIGHSFYRIRPFVFTPVQCYHCQRIGHVADSCRSKVRCLICGEQHNKEVCKSGSVKCALCNGPHKANDKMCIYVRNAREVEKRKANGERHSEAISNIRESQKRTKEQLPQTNVQNGRQNIVVAAEVHHAMSSQVNNRSYSGVLMGNKLENKIETELREMQAKQKRLENNIVAMIGKVLEQHTIKLITKVTECIAELFCSSIMRESDKNKKLLIQSIINHHLPVQSKERQSLDEEEIRLEPIKSQDKIEVEMEVLSSDGEISSDSMEDAPRNKRTRKEQNDVGNRNKRKSSQQNEENTKGKKNKGKK